MASTSKCPYCGNVVRSDESKCPNCGAANEFFVVDTPRTVFLPKTIEELKEYCAERGMPLLRMRFIGEDYRQPKAFGIYRDGRDVVVYKNKADGSRAIRYRGPDEAHAVNELFQKLLSECHNRGIYPDGKPLTRGGSFGDTGSSFRKSRKSLPFIILLGLVGVISYFVLTLRFAPYLFLYSLAFLVAACFGFPLSALPFKLIQIKEPWPKDCGDRCNASSATWRDCLRFVKKALRYPSPAGWQLSPREQAARKKVGWVPAALKVLSGILLSLLILLTVRSIILQNIEDRRARTEARLIQIQKDDGYYDFGDGRLYNNYFDDWYYTAADGSSELWVEMRGDPRSPGGTFYSAAEKENAFLGAEWDPEWPGQARSYANTRDLSDGKGYYDFGDGRIYYHRDNLWFYSSADSTGAWSVFSGSDDYELSLRDGSTVSALDYGQYYLAEDWDSDWGVSDVENSSAWDTYYGYHPSSDSSGSSSDYDSWDSDNTDWYSDW